MTSLRPFAAGLVACALLAGPAHASPDTLRRSLENLTQAPFDLVLSPYTGLAATEQNLPHLGDSTLERGLYFFPAWVGLTMLNAFSSVLRFGSGAVQLPPGVALFPFPERDLGPGWDPFREGPALLEVENPLGDSVLRWIPPLTLLTLDAKVGITSPAASYVIPKRDAP